MCIRDRVCSDSDVAEVERLVSDHGLAWETVWLMPEGKTHEEVMRSAAVLAEHCKRLGCNLTLRMHASIWGAKRGV